MKFLFKVEILFFLENVFIRIWGNLFDNWSEPDFWGAKKLETLILFGFFQRIKINIIAPRPQMILFLFYHINTIRKFNFRLDWFGKLFMFISRHNSTFGNWSFLHKFFEIIQDSLLLFIFLRKIRLLLKLQSFHELILPIECWQVLFKFKFLLFYLVLWFLDKFVISLRILYVTEFHIGVGNGRATRWTFNEIHFLL